MKVKAPGRINIIGEHTDYNDGYVLPFAVSKFVELKLEYSDKFLIYSKNLNEIIEINEIKKTNSWADYIIGVIYVMTKKGYDIPPLRIDLDSTIPIGAGLSSSAALEVAASYGISEFLNLNIPKIEIVKISREAEVDFVGVRCGIMDQFASTFGKKDHAIFLDTLTLKYEYIPLKLREYEIFVIDSNVKHELSSSEYNKRREECEAVLKTLHKKSFRQVSFDDLRKLDGILLKRAKHVLEENERVLKVKKSLEINDFKMVGKLLYESHQSLRDLYEVSCEETDYIVDYLRENEGVLGARMVGGGFGGGVIVLGNRGSLEKIKDDLKEKYYEKFSKIPEFYSLETSDGVSIIL